MPQPRAEDAEGPSGEAAYRRLLEEIRRGALTPGTRLRETELAERLGISRTPVREAIRLLEADGLVAHLPRQGATIRGLDHAEVIELYEMRAVLESTAARLAARSASEAELADLAALNAELAAAPDPHTGQQLNRQFHQSLLMAAKNRFLVKSVSALTKTMMVLGPTTLIEPSRAQTTLAEHARLLDALNARDGARAEAEMKAHIEGALRTRIRELRARERGVEE